MAGAVFTPAQRATCWERSGGHCEVCGCALRPQGWNLHHRQGRGMGGTKRKVTCADGLVICGQGNTSGCHRLMDTERSWAVLRGFVVSRHFPRPLTEAPVLWMGDWVYLSEDGSVTLLDAAAAETMNRGLVA